MFSPCPYRIDSPSRSLINANRRLPCRSCPQPSSHRMLPESRIPSITELGYAFHFFSTLRLPNKNAASWPVTPLTKRKVHEPPRSSRIMGILLPDSGDTSWIITELLLPLHQCTFSAVSFLIRERSGMIRPSTPIWQYRLQLPVR